MRKIVCAALFLAQLALPATAKITCTNTPARTGTLVLTDSVPPNRWLTFLIPGAGSTFSDCAFFPGRCSTYRCFAGSICQTATIGQCYRYVISQCRDGWVNFDPVIRSMSLVGGSPCLPGSK